MAQRRVILNDDQLDLLEAQFSGFTSDFTAHLPSLLAADGQRRPAVDGQRRPASDGGGEGALVPDSCLLADAENTPLAEWDGGTLTPMHPLARSLGPHWDARVRVPADSVASRTLGANVLGLVIEDLPTNGGLQYATGLAKGFDSVEVLVPVARSAGVGGGAGGVGAAAVGAAGLGTSRARIRQFVATKGQSPNHVTALPWPAAPQFRFDLAALAQRLNLARLVPLSTPQTTAEAVQFAAVDAQWRAAIGTVYPAPSAREIFRATAQLSAAKGTVVLFSGLSGSGKSTIAKALAAQLTDDGIANTLLDGDEVRQHLSKGLGFDAESRAINLDRIGYVAALVAKHGGIAIAAPIAPFAASRDGIRGQAQAVGVRFLLVYVNTPLAVCESRDRKGLYAQARQGLIADFTGINSPYEEPTDADLVIDTTTTSVPDAVAAVLTLLNRSPA